MNDDFPDTCFFGIGNPLINSQTFSITGSYKELTDETEESGEAQADTQTAQ